MCPECTKKALIPYLDKKEIEGNDEIYTTKRKEYECGAQSKITGDHEIASSVVLIVQDAYATLHGHTVLCLFCFVLCRADS